MSLTPINDFFANIKDKISNPFFGTLIFVWLTRNWDLIYSIFNFDWNTNLDQKLDFIRIYIEKNFSLLNLSINIIITLAIIIIGYMLIIISRSISTLVEFRIMPYLTGKIISNKVVNKEEYDKVKSERDAYSESYEEKRKQTRELSEQFEQITDSYKNQSNLVIENTNKINTLEREILIRDEKINKINKNLSIKDIEIKNLQADNEKIQTSLEFSKLLESTYYSQFKNSFTYEHTEFYRKNLDKFPEINKICSELNKNNQYEVFLNVFNFLTRGGSIDQDSLHKMAKLNLILINNKGSEYLTPIARVIYNIINNKN